LLSFARPEFVLQDEKLIKDRIESNCAVIKGKDGSPLVAIIGGFNQKGMEVWNPTTGEVELLWNEIPPEVGSSPGLAQAELIPVNGGLELLVYGGFPSKDDIWKYTVETNAWTKYIKHIV